LVIDYRPLLEIAVDAAYAAGRLLRDALLTVRGPAGHSRHASINTEAERLLRRLLLPATPDWGLLSQSLGYVPPRTPPKSGDSQHLWLLDPHVGTMAYLQGYRGSAISIALLRDGSPIGGVVYAFAAPDNRGDMFCWAEHCGPILRNGLAVARRPWSSTYDSNTVVLVNHEADRAVDTYINLLHPARYRSEASLAYRLALAAVGEGDVSLSLAQADSWNYGAGHALLRASGGRLVDQDGLPVLYSAEGFGRIQASVGGAPDLVTTIASRVRLDIPQSSRNNSEEPYRLCRPVHGAKISEDSLLCRAQGVMLGQLAGDALGSMVEFQSAEQIRHQYPDGLTEIGPSRIFDTIAGQPTDDSELALVLARTLLRDKAYDDEAVAAAYGYWRASGPFDLGPATNAATRAIIAAGARRTSRVEAARSAALQTTESNGALMRQSPLAVWGHTLQPERLAAVVRADTSLTHPNPICMDSSEVFVVTLAAVIRDTLDAEEAYAFALDWHNVHGRTSEVGYTLQQARHQAPVFQPNEGSVLITLQNAFFQALHATDLAHAIISTVLSGGDTDTNAAVAGALLGALYGARAVPVQWTQMLLTCRPHYATPDVRRPRPQAFWPVDVYHLAERLLFSATTLGYDGDSDRLSRTA
jgi:ADP-ribosyl-[dinitrogen reductase] hydrolase